MRRISIRVMSVIVLSVLLGSARAQLPLTVDDATKITPAFDASAANSLKCGIDEWKPTLDFAFRFMTGYVVHCRLGLFEGKKVTLTTYLRVTPEGRAPALLGTAHVLPAITPEMLRFAGGDPKKLKNEIAISGAFAVGEGDYSVEALVMDDQRRACRKRWKVHATANRSQRDVPLAIEPLTVESMDRSAWQISPPQQRGGIRVTLLLDAAPLNPYQSSLHAWDRLFLLECIYSLLRQTPHKSVRLVAFSLDQQREIFRAGKFDEAGFLALSHALGETETASVSVQALRKRNSPEFLSGLANQELSAADSSDAVIFLGPNARLNVKMTAELLTGKKPTSPAFFYFEYFPWPGREFPDAIQTLVKAADGKTFKIHSPAELDQAIQKMLARLKQE